MTTSNKKAAIYARVSTTDQDTDSQIEKCTRFAKERDDIAEYDVYSDILSGKDDTREDFQNLVDSVNNEEYDVFIATEFSRISRNDSTIQKFVSRLFDKEMDVYLLDDGFSCSGDEDDITRQAKKIVADILANIATMELLQKNERRDRGIQWAREQGRWNRKPPVGFEVVKKHLRVKEQEFLEVRQALIDHRKNGTSWSELGRQTGFDRSTLSKIYKNDEKRRLYLYGEGYDELGRIDMALENAEFKTLLASKRDEVGTSIEDLNAEELGKLVREQFGGGDGE